MADKPHSTEFGKRRPAPLPDQPKASPKRSSHVALLVMGTLAVGAGASTLMGRQNCEQPASGAAISAQPQTQATCTSNRSSFSGSHGNYSRTMHLNFFGGGYSSSHNSSSSGSESGSVSRGGFGAFAHAFGFSGRS
jgi:hypothetical protein